MRPEADIAGCRRAHEMLRTTLVGVTEEVVRRPSLLPGWTVAHVIAHLARNAEAAERRIEAAGRGIQIEQYPGGHAGRAAQIEESAEQPAAQLVDDALAWSDALDATFARIPDGSWDLRVLTLDRDERPISQMPLGRWCEVEVHTADLGLGFTAADWSSELVDRWLPRLVSRLPGRCDARTLMAWTLGRSDPPDLAPWR